MKMAEAAKTTLQSSQVPEFLGRPLEAQGFCGFPRAKCTTSTRAKERRRVKRRQRAVARALDYLQSELGGSGFRRWAWAKQKVATHERPLKEAKRIVAWARTYAATSGEPNPDRWERFTEANTPDLSDVQEVRVKLLRRDHVLDQPQAAVLARMERMIAGDKMDWQGFERMVGTVLGMKSALPKKAKKAEREHLRLENSRRFQVAGSTTGTRDGPPGG